MEPVVFFSFFFITIAMSAIIHEYSHGWMADQLGDATARLAGRLTLNPIPHIDPLWTILLPVVMLIMSGGSFLFAAAKPVPVNPYNLQGKKYAVASVSFAGPGSNLIIALIFGLLFRFLPVGNFTNFLGIVVYANILLAVFNLVPIPPLDGSKILFDFLPERFHNVRVFLETYGFIILIFFIFFLFGFIRPIISGLFSLFTGYNFESFLFSILA